MTTITGEPEFDRAAEIERCRARSVEAHQKSVRSHPEHAEFKTCSISHPRRCTHAQLPPGPWCECHWPYRCFCGAIGTECVPYSTFDTDQDRWYCAKHYDQLPESEK